MKKLSHFICPNCGHKLEQSEIRNIYTFWRGPVISECSKCHAKLTLNKSLRNKFRIANILLKSGLICLVLGIFMKYTTPLAEWAVLLVIYSGTFVALIGLFLAQPSGTNIIVTADD